MICLPRSVAAWPGDAFNDTFKVEVEQLKHHELPLQQGLSLSSYVSEEPFRMMVLEAHEDGTTLHVRAGVFYSGIIAGCSCADDPTPTDVQTEYCDLAFSIDKDSGEARVSLLGD
jgi:hypothetical protein